VPSRAEHLVARVLMTADAVGGVWPYAVDLGRAYRGRGVDVTLAVMGPEPTAAQQAAALAAGLDLVHHPGRLEWMPGAGRDVDLAGEWLLGLSQRVRPDLMHLNGYAHAVLPWHVPAIVVAHSCVRTWWRAVHGREAPAEWTLYTNRVRAGLRAAATVVAPSRAMLHGLREEYGRAFTGQVIPNGSAALPQRAVAPAKTRCVLASGRLWDEAKNITAVCEVAPSLPWPTYVAGEAAHPCGGRFDAGDAVRLLGRLPAAEMGAWLQRAAIFVSPARYEPFGLCVLEAAAAGCALVLGDIPSLRENWEGCAVFVPPDDPATLRRALTSLAADDGRRARLAAAARARARRFTIDAMADRYLRLYRNLLTAAAAA
jgi:glycosyltransferase involved in cell wall biosynthesis